MMGLRRLRLSFPRKHFGERFPWNFSVDERGSELVEMALVLPVVILLGFVTIDTMLFFSSYLGATYGSRIAVRYATVHGASSQNPCTASTLAGMVAPYTKTLLSGSVQTTTTWSPNNAVGSTVSVKVVLQMNTGLPGAELQSLTATSTAAGIILQ